MKSRALSEAGSIDPLPAGVIVSVLFIQNPMRRRGSHPTLPERFKRDYQRLKSTSPASGEQPLRASRVGSVSKTHKWFIEPV